MTNPAPGQPPAPHPPGSAWPQQGAQQQEPTALLPAAQPHAPNERAQPQPTPHEPAQQAPDDATIRLPQVQPGPPQAQLPPPYWAAQQNAFGQPPFAQGPQQQWPPQGPGYPPGTPGQPGPYGAAPPSRKRNRILIGVVAGVAALAVLATGVVLTMQQGAGTPTAPDVAASPLDGLAPDSESPGSELPGSGDSEAVLEELSVSLQSNLNDRDVEGLLETVCENGKVDDAARTDLMEFPFLDPSSSQYSDPINFPEGSVGLDPNADDGSYLIDFLGSYTSTEEPIHLTFKAHVYSDGSGAVWCGVA